jgi:4-hydroxy-3-polyprenylbenzoate decarboxylase
MHTMREFISLLEEKKDILHVTKPVSGEEVAALIWELNERKGPALWCEHVKGSSVPLVANLLGSFDRVALALGMPAGAPPREIRNHYAEIMEDRTRWLTPVMVKTGPCKDAIYKGDEVNLFHFPLFKWAPGDGGPYITLNGTVSKDPELGRNVGMYRVHVINKNTTGIMALSMQDIGIHLARAKQRGEEYLEVAVVIGMSPAVYFAATTKMAAVTEDEYALAGGLQGHPVELVRCETINVDVPADSEIVIEGRLYHTEPLQEGPYGEWMGYYEESMITPTFHVTCITHRKDPLYATGSMGHQYGEGEVFRYLPIQANLYNVLKRSVIGFRDVYLPLQGRGYKAVVQIKKRYPGWGKQAIYAAFSAGYINSSVNWVTIVDEDIDIYDLNQVYFAEATRVDPELDVVVLPVQGVYPLNPAARDRYEAKDLGHESGFTEFAWCSKIGIDATRKYVDEHRRATPDRVIPDLETLHMVRQDWESYFKKQ